MDEKAAEARRAYRRQWARDNREKVRAYRRKWAKENPEKVRACHERYWAKKAEQAAEAERTTTPPADSQRERV